MGFPLTSKDRAKLEGVHPDLVRVIERAAHISDIPFRLTEGVRSYERQRQLVAKGASKTMNSRHLTGHAVDLVPTVDLNGDGRLDAGEIYHWPLYHKLAPTIKRAAKECGVRIEWGGDWRSFKDGPHWQLPWKQYPKAVKFAALGEQRRYTEETERAANVKEGAAAGALGVSAAGTTVGPALPDIAAAIADQQYELTSGDWTRIAIAGVLVAITIYVIWRKARA